MAPVTKMRIHRFGNKEVLQADNVEPSLPDAGQVLVAVCAASVNPVDFKIRSGKYPAVKDDRLPYTLGRDFSGIVEKCGAQATRFKVGDEVFGIVNIYGGGYSEKVAVDERAIALKPASIAHTHAAAIPLAGQTAWQGLFRHGQLKAGQTVLFHGDLAASATTPFSSPKR
jgi:NADPH:quinone reductase-like Zn-dependent oxidoreductase